MFNRTKYIRTKKDQIIVFPATLDHSSFKNKVPVSAGFINFGVDKNGNVCCSCFGESYTLSMKSDPEKDTQ